MSAVIGILNKTAVALAADSAATIPGPKGSKILNHANKIFRLSKNAPIALMVYNHAEFMGISWEVIAKEYRKKLGINMFPRLDDYKNDFLKYLLSSFSFEIAEQQDTLRFMLVDLLERHIEEVISFHQSIIQAQHPDLSTIIGNALYARLIQISKDLSASKQNNNFKNFEKSEYEKFRPTNHDLDIVVHQVIKSKGIKGNTEDLIKVLSEILFNLIKSNQFYNFYSGLVFVGYGEKDIFPSIKSIKVSNALGDKLRYEDDATKSHEINYKNFSGIFPFAQTDVIDTILSGIEPAMNNLYMQQFKSYIKKHNDAIATMVQEAGNQSLANNIRNLNINPLAQTLDRLLSQQRNNNYIMPMMRAVGTLSKEDLAEMAESLIYLTYLKRRFTFAQESVGGPVDVAILTKGDGFIWIKRKHYFDVSLNPHFIKNY